MTALLIYHHHQNIHGNSMQAALRTYNSQQVLAMVSTWFHLLSHRIDMASCLNNTNWSKKVITDFVIRYFVIFFYQTTAPLGLSTDPEHMGPRTTRWKPQPQFFLRTL